MSGISNTFFDGKFCRAPVQNLGGRTGPNFTREALLERAQADRHQREVARKQAFSIVIIQATARGFLARRRLIKSCREEYYHVTETTDCSSLDKQGEQISRLIRFYPWSRAYRSTPVLEDAVHFASQTNQLGLHKNELWEKCLKDPVWAHRIQCFVRLAMEWHNYENSSSQIMKISTEVTSFLNWFHQGLDSEELLPFFVRLWMNAVRGDNFFHVKLKHYSTIQDLKQVGHLNKDLLFKSIKEEFFTVFGLPFVLIRKLADLKNTFQIDQRNIVEKNRRKRYTTTVTSKYVMSEIFAEFTSNICYEVLIKDTSVGLFDAEHLLREFSLRFPTRQWVSYLINDHDIARINFETRNTNQERVLRHRRCLLYAILLMVPPKSFPEHHNDLITLIAQHIDAVDNQYSTWLDLRSVGLEEELPDPDDEEEVMETDYEEGRREQRNPALNQSYQDKINQRLMVITKLVDEWPHIQLGDWVNPSSSLRHKMISILSCLIRTDPKRAAITFPFLAKLAFNREYVRKLYDDLKLNQSNIRENVHGALAFTWLYTHLINTLHDAEFLASNPLERDELSVFVVELVEIYSNILIVNDTKHYNLDKSLLWIITRCLQLLHDRNTRLQIFQDDVFESYTVKSFCPIRDHDITFNSFQEATSYERLYYPYSRETILLEVLHEFPFCIPFHDRVVVWQGLVEAERSERFVSPVTEVIQIRRNMLYEDTYEKLSYENVPDLKNPIRISLVNTVGLLEAGVDGGGLLREFLTEATKAGVDPNRGLFRLDTQNRIYPNPIAKKIIPDYHKHYFLIGRLVGKALYEQTLLELPLAGFFIQKCISGQVNHAVDYLATLDPALHKHLLSLKSYTGDFNSLGLDFTMTSNELGETETINLKENGSSIAVDKENVIEYIHLVADYKINREIEEECIYFRRGLVSVSPIFKIFSWCEMQTLISGSDVPIDVEDWKTYTHYGSGFTAEHPCIKIFWDVVGSLDEVHLRRLLKFVTSCSRPPLFGFKELIPNFGIQNAGKVDRLPTAATCMNLLKLPEFEDGKILRERLIYAIDAQAGFELS